MGTSLPFLRQDPGMDDTKVPKVSNSYIHAHHAPMMEYDPPDRSRRAASVLSMDDLEAAQALEGLRSGESSRG